MSAISCRIERIWDVTLTVSDLNTAADFYENILGLTKKYVFGDYAGFDCGGVELGLKTWGKLEKPREGEPCIDFLVNDVDTFARLLETKGITFIRKPKDTMWGSRTAVFTDPDGNTLQLTQIDWKRYFEVCAK